MIKKRLVGLLSHAKKYIVYNILWQWVALLAQIAVIFTVAGLLEGTLMGTAGRKTVYSAVLILVCAMLLRYFCDRMAVRASYAASVDVKRVLREKIYEKLLKLGTSYREQTSTSEIVQLATEGVEQLETYFGRYLPQFFYSLLAPVTLFLILSFVNWKASVILLICVPLIPVSIVAVQKFAKKLLNKYWGIYANLGDSFLENLQGLTTLKIYQADEQKAKEMDEESARFRKITMKVLTMQLNSTSVMDVIAYGGAAIGMIVAMTEYGKGNVGFAGTFTALVGASGCGKSTVAGILMGRNRGYQGTVTINGIAIPEISEQSLMSHVTLVTHNSYLFQGTVEENLRMAKSNATEEEMWAVLRKVNLEGFLLTQEGLDTKVQEKGSNFSGGQCQRLALARALLHDTPMYIFDEATSNIDVESEEWIMNVIHELAEKKTVILISHRLANVVRADQIYFLQDAQIEEYGTHESLMERKGTYQKLYSYQSRLEQYGFTEKNTKRKEVGACVNR